MTKTEYIVWGKSPATPETEEPLFTSAKTRTEAEKAIKILGEKHGCTDMRIQVLDLEEPLDWQASMEEAILRRSVEKREQNA